MATTYEMPTYAAPARVNVDGHEVRRVVSFTPATWALNDVFKVAKLPLNAKITGGWILECPDIDSSTGATVSVIIVDGGTTKTIISGATTPQAGGIVYDSSATYGQQTGVLNYKITTTSAYVAVKAAAAATGTFTAGAFKLQLSYTDGLEFND